MLDNRHNLRFNAPARAKSRAGIGVPLRVAKATSSSSVAFLLPVFRLWRPGAGSRKARRFTCPVRQPASGRHPIGVGGDLNYPLRNKPMTTTAKPSRNPHCEQQWPRGHCESHFVAERLEDCEVIA